MEIKKAIYSFFMVLLMCVSAVPALAEITPDCDLIEVTPEGEEFEFNGILLEVADIDFADENIDLKFLETGITHHMDIGSGVERDGISIRLIDIDEIAGESFATLCLNKIYSNLELDIVSLNNEIIFDAEGSPDDPYAMEYTRISLIVKNTGQSAISKADLLANVPQITAEDFVVQDDLGFVPNGGYWNKAYDYDLQPGQKAQVWVQGYFTSGGAKDVSATAGGDIYTTTIGVLADPGCYDSDGGADSNEKGWAIGTVACTNQANCLTSTRSEDKCENGKLNEYVCLADPRTGVKRKYVNFIDDCACSDGACVGGQDEPEEIPTQCTDSDNGIDYYNKGTIHGLWAYDSHPSAKEGEKDYCAWVNKENEVSSCEGNSCMLVEFHCTSSTHFGNTPYTCPYGCSNGKCNPEPEETPEVQCTDTDGGLDYYTRGKGTGLYSQSQETGVIWGENPNKASARWDTSMDYSIVYDHCANSPDLKQLNEAYCDANGNLMSRAYQCPYGCANGACLREPVEEEEVNFDLSGYPNMFIDDGAFYDFVVVGDNAPASDVVAAVDILTGIKYAATQNQGSTTINTIEVGAAKLASEISNPLNLNIISVGNPCNNAVSDQYMGNPEPCTKGLRNGEGQIRLSRYYNKYQIVVTGYSDSDVRKAARVLANYEDYDLSGACVSVTGDFSNPVIGRCRYSSDDYNAIPEPQEPGLQDSPNPFWISGQYKTEKIVDGAEHEFSVVYADPEGETCKIKVDSEVSDLIPEGESETVSGVKMMVMDELRLHQDGRTGYLCQVKVSGQVQQRTQTEPAEPVDGGEPDLVITSVSSKGVLKESSGFQVPYLRLAITVKNIGDGSALLSPSRLGTTGVWAKLNGEDIGWVQFVTEKNPDMYLDAGESRTYYWDYNDRTHNAKLKEQNTIVFFADRVYGDDALHYLPNGKVKESNEANNKYTYRFTVSKCSDTETGTSANVAGKVKMFGVTTADNYDSDKQMVREYWCASDFVVGYGYRYSGGSTSEPGEVEESEESYIVIPDGSGSCSGQGCPVDSTCVGTGVRLVDDETPVYCDLDGSLRSQKEDGETCQNNYECLSNSCGNGECQNYDERLGALEQEMEETRNIISRIMSWIRGWFGGDDDYEEEPEPVDEEEEEVEVPEGASPVIEEDFGVLTYKSTSTSNFCDFVHDTSCELYSAEYSYEGKSARIVAGVEVHPEEFTNQEAIEGIMGEFGREGYTTKKEGYGGNSLYTFTSGQYPDHQYIVAWYSGKNVVALYLDNSPAVLTDAEVDDAFEDSLIKYYIARYPSDLRFE